MSSCNSGLYSIGRIMRTLAAEHSAPAFTARLSRHQVPHGGVLLTGGFYLLGVLLNEAVPGQAFNIAISMASVGVLWTWGTIFACQLRFRQAVARGDVSAPAFRMPGSPWTSWLGIFFLVLVFVLLGFDQAVGAWTMVFTPVVGVLIGIGWLAAQRSRRRASTTPG
jgi:L-asparagine permease